jgi:hypothetical protein
MFELTVNVYFCDLRLYIYIYLPKKLGYTLNSEFGETSNHFSNTRKVYIYIYWYIFAQMAHAHFLGRKKKLNIFR